MKLRRKRTMMSSWCTIIGSRILYHPFLTYGTTQPEYRPAKRYCKKIGASSCPRIKGLRPGSECTNIIFFHMWKNAMRHNRSIRPTRICCNSEPKQYQQESRSELMFLYKRRMIKTIMFCRSHGHLHLIPEVLQHGYIRPRRRSLHLVPSNSGVSSSSQGSSTYFSFCSLVRIREGQPWRRSSLLSRCTGI